LIRSEPPVVIELEESISLPIPLSLPISLPIPMSIGGVSGGSGGRATGRLGAEEELDGLERDADGLERDADGLEAEEELLPLLPRFTADRLPSSRPARLTVLLLRLLVLAFLAVVDFDLARLLPPRLPSVRAARLAVIRFGFELDLAVDRLAVDFLPEDFFFAAIDPPLGYTISYS
jgi:hypothetical protein